MRLERHLLTLILVINSSLTFCAGWNTNGATLAKLSHSVCLNGALLTDNCAPQLRSNDDNDYRSDDQEQEISVSAPQLASHIRLRHFPLGGSVTYISAPGGSTPSPQVLLHFSVVLVLLNMCSDVISMSRCSAQCSDIPQSWTAAC